MRVAVLGCGQQGRYVSRTLAGCDAVSALIVADKFPEAAALAAKKAGPKATPKEVDVTDRKSLDAILEQADVVFNAVGPFYKYFKGVLEAAIDHKVNYVDISDDFDATTELFTNPEYDRLAKKAGILVLSCIGETPGLSNLFAKYASQQLDRTQAVHITFVYKYWRVQTSVYRHLFHCLNGDVTQYLGGKWTMVPAFGGQQTVQFLDPVGPRDVYYLGHSEPITIPRFIKGLEEVTVRCACYQPEANELLRGLVKYGFANQKSLANGKSPADFATEYMASPEGEPYFEVKMPDLPGGVMQVEVLGTKGKEHIRFVYEVQDDTGHVVGSAAATAVEAVVRGQIRGKGVYAPEGCIDDPAPFLAKALQIPGVNVYHRKEVSVPLSF